MGTLRSDLNEMLYRAITRAPVTPTAVELPRWVRAVRQAEWILIHTRWIVVSDETLQDLDDLIDYLENLS